MDKRWKKHRKSRAVNTTSVQTAQNLKKVRKAHVWNRLMGESSRPIAGFKGDYI